jgi:hypothetical protein
VVTGGLLLVLGVLSFVAIPKLWKRSQEVWTETQGTVAESYIFEGVRKSSAGKNKTSHTPTYEVRLKYGYQANGQALSGDERALQQPHDNEKRMMAVAIQESYKAGDTIAVFYRPGEAERSRFTAKEATIEFKKDLFFVAVYLLGGGVLFWLGRKMLR